MSEKKITAEEALINMLKGRMVYQGCVGYIYKDGKIIVFNPISETPENIEIDTFIKDTSLFVIVDLLLEESLPWPKANKFYIYKDSKSSNPFSGAYPIMAMYPYKKHIVIKGKEMCIKEFWDKFEEWDER